MKKELMPLENVNAVTIFQEGGLDDLLKAIHAEAESHVPDLETDKGRKAIASIAAKVAKSKTYLDGLGKDMVAGWKNQAKVVDGGRKRMREDLDDLKAKVRKPLTDFENEQAARAEHIQSVISEIATAGTHAEANWIQMPLDQIKDNMTFVNTLYRESDFGDQGEYAAEVISRAKDKIISAMNQREEYDINQAELERLRKEADERNAESSKKAAAQKIEDDKKKAADAAVKTEQDRVAAAKKADEDETAERETDIKHRRAVNSKAAEALVKTGIDAEQAKKVLSAIVKCRIPNVTISY